MMGKSDAIISDYELMRRVTAAMFSFHPCACLTAIPLHAFIGPSKLVLNRFVTRASAGDILAQQNEAGTTNQYQKMPECLTDFSPQKSDYQKQRVGAEHLSKKQTTGKQPLSLVRTWHTDSTDEEKERKGMLVQSPIDVRRV